MSLPPLALPENQLAIRRAALAHCAEQDWAALNEFALPDGRRADIMALLPDQTLACIEIKSGPADFRLDQKWPDYRAWSDQLFFAVDDRFALDLLPDDVGIIVAATSTLAPLPGIVADCAIVRPAPRHPLAPARRRTLTTLFARTAAQRLMRLEDPQITASLRAARRVD